VTILRNHHPLQGKALELFSWTHRHGALHLTLVLPDGSRSLIPASWTDLDPNAFPNVTPSAVTIGTISHLLQAHKVVDALLQRFDSPGQLPTIPLKEESTRASTISPMAPSSRKAPATRHLARPRLRQPKSSHRRPGQTDRKGSLSAKPDANPGGQP
jgi:hypothetical protein